MNEVAWFPIACFFAGLAMLVTVGLVAFWALRWLDRSESPRAAHLRRLLGGSERLRQSGGRRFLWAGEERALAGTAIRDFAAKRGYGYEAGSLTLLPMLEPFRTLVQQSPSVEHVAQWQDDLHRYSLFSYTYEGSESSETSTLLLIETAQLPQFFVTDKTLGHSLFFSGRNIDLADDAEFSARYHLESGDEATVRELFNREVRAELIDTRRSRRSRTSSVIRCAYSTRSQGDG